MSEQTIQNHGYMVSIYEPEGPGGRLMFTFVPKGHSIAAGVPKRAPQFIIAVRQEETGATVLDWHGTPDNPGAAKAEIEAEILARMNDRSIWINRVNTLVDQLEQWARELHWSTRRIEKKLEDARIGEHRVPALLLQEDTCRILLEPVGRAAPGAEGVAELYLMPAYDDIASLYFYGNQWNVHYTFPSTKSVATVRDAVVMPLSIGTLDKVISEMKRNAA